jgi:UDP-N-acetylglucosamine acyltransferase
LNTKSIHASALIHKGAKLGAVEVGPYAVVERDVELGDGVVIGPHSVVRSGTRVGARTFVDAHVVLGGTPQDAGHDPAKETRLVIGSDCVFREFTTAHRGSSNGQGLTEIGDHCLFMANSHVAHDCRLGRNVVFTNSAAIAGHVDIGDGAVLGGLCAVHQHARIGRLAMVGGGAMCAQDVPPFSVAQGDRARLYGLNIIGLRRAGMSHDNLTALKEAWRSIFSRDLPRQDALRRVDEQFGEVPEVAELLQFMRTSRRGVCRAGAR